MEGLATGYVSSSMERMNTSGYVSSDRHAVSPVLLLSTGGVGARVDEIGVGGADKPNRRLFQNPALGPLPTNARVHLERPRKVSGRWMAAVRSVDRDKIKTNLSTTAFKNCAYSNHDIDVPFGPAHALHAALHPAVGYTGPDCSG